MTIIARRGFITGLAALVAAPALVRADSLMKIQGVPLYPSKFMTVTLEGHGNVPGFGLATLKEEGKAVFWDTDLKFPALTHTIEVPWLGSSETSMAWYRNKLLEVQPCFSRVDSILWQEHRPGPARVYSNSHKLWSNRGLELELKEPLKLNGPAATPKP